MSYILPGASDEVDFTALVSILDSLPEPRILMDTHYRIIAANRAYREAYGCTESITGRFCFDVSHHIDRPCDLAGESCPLAQARRTGTTHRVLHLHHTPHGEEHVLVETTPIRDRGGDIRFFVETLNVVRHASSQSASQGMVGRSPAFRRMLDRLMRVAPSDAAVLLLGETGTGKELAARVVHEASARAAGPFVAVDCSGLCETLFESECFGHEKGAFTGAAQRKIGLVEAARGGTLFLDEMGDVPHSMQMKLLRLLETNTFRRLGGIDTLNADFRLVAATHRDLPGMVREGTFRRDLYYRINTFPVRLPPLAERREDIALLATSLLERVDRLSGRSFSPAALRWLEERPFEGNIRELRNLVERATLLADGPVIEPEHFEQDDAVSPLTAGPVFTLPGIVPLDEAERRYLDWATAHHEGERADLAQRLGVSTRTLFRKLGARAPD